MSIYLNDQPIKNKYYFWYFNLVEKAKKNTEKYTCYTELHHILPKCLGGNDSEDNLVKLTLREHYIAHLLLSKMYEGGAKRKMYYGLWRMLLDVKVRNSRVFELYRKKYIENSLNTQIISEETRRKISENTKGIPKTKTDKLLNDWERRKTVYSGTGNPRYGIELSEDTKTKISLAHKGKKHSEETKRKISESGKGKSRPAGMNVGQKNPMFGKKHSEETRRKISEAGKRRYQALDK